MSDPNKQKQQIGGVNVSNISDGQVNVEGDVDAGVRAGGDKHVTHIHNYITNPAELPPLFSNVPAMSNHFVGRDDMCLSLRKWTTRGYSNLKQYWSGRA